MTEKEKETVEQTAAPLPQQGGVQLGKILVLENDKNKKGDLFNSLVFDVFHPLGFEHPRYNVAKPGRELDLIAPHRTERRIAIVESKAHEKPIGGDEVNKFFGAVDAECGDYSAMGYEVVGYYVSKSGFTASALEQEEKRAARRREGSPEIILLGPERIAEELVRGNILCSVEEAVRAVGLPAEPKLELCRRADLLASEKGWIWALYYSPAPRQAATHVAFVHADGKRLLNSKAREILAQESKQFSGLEYLFAADDPEEAERGKREAKQAYFAYLDRELGEMRYEGLPVDKEAGAVRVKLENAFVPLRFYAAGVKDRKAETEEPGQEKPSKLSIRDVLTGSDRAALLARPGGGKSTLIGRIALACAFPERREKVDDDLPELGLFPVYLRCRDLRGSVRESITEMIYQIIRRAERPQLEKEFRALVEETLQTGRILLLIDGLDEIADEDDRIGFADQLRRFVGTYPGAHLLLTSRETGFRAVAGAVRHYCAEYSIADLDEDQIRKLSLYWHRAMLNDETRAKQESEKVCGIILGDKRIRALAVNPLLLTTLLFVKRSAGYLPTKRCDLYEKMITLLLESWNAEGHGRLDLKETEAQLAFVAHDMTRRGQQTITRRELESCVIRARREIPDVLGYTRISPAQFIDQVEDRSSLLILRGQEEDETGRLVPSYEFSHLSFQEYLTARAIVESWLPADAEQDVVSLLQNHLEEAQWIEVIPLAAVLSGRKAAKEIVSKLLEKAKTEPDWAEGRYIPAKYGRVKVNYAALHLANCMANELPFGEAELKEANEICAENREFIINAVPKENERSSNVFETILNSKYGPRYRETVETLLFNKADIEYKQFLDAWEEVYTVGYVDENGDASLEQIAVLLNSEKREEKIAGALLGMELCFGADVKKANKLRKEEALRSIASPLAAMLESGDKSCIFSAAWCIAWAGYNYRNLIPEDLVSGLTERVARLWIRTNLPAHLKRQLSWALKSLICEDVILEDTPMLREAVSRNLESRENDSDAIAALFVGFRIGMLTKEETEEHIRDRIEDWDFGFRFDPDRTRFLRDRGIDAQQILRKGSNHD